jgi:hypothetical protein
MDVIDLTDVQWERNLTSYTSGGAYLKASREIGGAKQYLKLSNYDDERGCIGCESVYEYLASKLGAYLGCAVLDCMLFKARIVHNGREYVTYVQATEDFLQSGMSKVPFEQLTNGDFGTRYLEDNLSLIQSQRLRLSPANKRLLQDKLFSLFDADEGFPAWHKDKAMELIVKRMDHAQAILDNR